MVDKARVMSITKYVNQHVRMVYRASCDTEGWINCAKNSGLS